MGSGLLSSPSNDVGIGSLASIHRGSAFVHRFRTARKVASFRSKSDPYVWDFLTLAPEEELEYLVLEDYVREHFNLASLPKDELRAPISSVT